MFVSGNCRCGPVITQQDFQSGDSGIAEDPACKTAGNCDCCSSNPTNGSREMMDICNQTYNINYRWYCTYGCKDGYYGRRCYNNCPSYCTRCAHEFGYSGHQDYQICYLCADGYYNGTGVTNCSTPCPSNCAENQCDKTTGDCLHGCASNNWSGDKCNVCSDTWYGIDCTTPCPSKCKDRKCDSNGSCTLGCADVNFTGQQCDQCRAGKYGDNCQVNCPENCKNELCDRDNGACRDGCNGNFFGARCDMCLPHYYGMDCEKACLRCLNGTCDQTTGLCNDCDIGKFGDFCDKPCSFGCKSAVCNRYDAICTEGCKHGFSGDKCCVVNDYCEKCDSTATCTQCASGHYGDSCSLDCPQNCYGGCVKDSGHCYFCANGYYGQTCTQKCSTNCYEAECLMTDGTCLSCKNGHYGPKCNNTCPDNCVNKICDQEDGMCLRCKTGYHGRSCDLECSLNCKDNVCDQDTGSCKLGCVNEEKNGCESSTVTPDMSERQTMIMIGALVGGLILILIIVQVQWYIVRRLSRRKSSEQNYMKPNRSRQNEENDEGTYDNPDLYNDGEL
ncbi:hypothetical protein ACF0H5_024039 [Mactra antiquata]